MLKISSPHSYLVLTLRLAAFGGLLNSACGDASTGSEGDGADESGGTNSAIPGSGGSPDSGGTGGTGGTGGLGPSAGGAGDDATSGGATGAGGIDAATGGSVGVGCDAKDYLICEDFEETAAGSIPSGWTSEGAVTVTDQTAASGTHSLAISPQNNGSRRIKHPGQLLGSAHYGRILYKVQLPVPDNFVHSTLVAMQGDGPTVGSEEMRVVDTVKSSHGNGGNHQFLYNVQPNGGEFGKGSDYDFTFTDEWRCAEWHVDSATQAYEFFIDGDRLDSISFENGAGNYDDSEIPTVIEEVRVGWNNYQSAPPGFTAWIDDIILDDERVGCPAP